MDKFVTRKRSPTEVEEEPPPRPPTAPRSRSSKSEVHHGSDVAIGKTGCSLLWSLEAYRRKGKLSAAQEHALLGSLLASFCEVAAWSQEQRREQAVYTPLTRQSTSLDFDQEGVYFASAHHSRTLNIHAFDSLLLHSASKHGIAKSLLEVCLPAIPSSVRWNISYQDEVGIVSRRSASLDILNVAIEGSSWEKLSAPPRESCHSETSTVGFSEHCWVPSSKCRVLACGRNGRVYAWDRRMSKTMPCTTMVTPQRGQHSLATMQLAQDEQIICAGTASGAIFVWDWRGGKQSSAFSSGKNVQTLVDDEHAPVHKYHISALIEKVPDLQVQAGSVTSGLQTIRMNPANDYQLAFHLMNGWSGALNLRAHCVSHIHCPPATLETTEQCMTQMTRSGSWLGLQSVYCVPAAGYNLHMLDFLNTPKSRHAVIHDVHNHDNLVSQQADKAGHVPVSDSVLHIASHPTGSHLVAGTQVNCCFLDRSNDHYMLRDEEPLCTTQSFGETMPKWLLESCTDGVLLKFFKAPVPQQRQKWQPMATSDSNALLHCILNCCGGKGQDDEALARVECGRIYKLRAGGRWLLTAGHGKRADSASLELGVAQVPPEDVAVCDAEEEAGDHDGSLAEEVGWREEVGAGDGRREGKGDSAAGSGGQRRRFGGLEALGALVDDEVGELDPSRRLSLEAPPGARIDERQRRLPELLRRYLDVPLDLVHLRPGRPRWRPCSRGGAWPP
eukprot:SM000002S05554  [mRNA]  locus=s2:749005:755391:- [translate_table: standard]